MNVRFGSKADISACPTDVRFTPESGHWSAPSSAILALQVLILAQDRAKPAIRLSRKDWLLRADRAVLCPVPSAGCAFGILPRRLLRRGGASVVAAIVAAQPKEIPMPRTKSKCKTASRPIDSKTKTRNNVRRTTARVPLKPVAKPAAHQQSLSAPQPTVSRESKKARIIAMLRAPGGATIEAMARAAKWQPHSVRGFLAGVVRKKLGFTLVSADGENARVYRITDRMASGAA
jgi:Protein of unknown function (DUF3489)